MSTVQSVERTFQILEALAVAELNITEVANRVDLPKSTVSRLLGTLEELGAVERPDGGRYRIGASISALAGAANPIADLVSVARPSLTRLVRSIGEDAGLSVPDGHRVHYVDQVTSENQVQVRDWTGEQLPAHAVASGLVMMARWPEDRLGRFLERPLQAFTEVTVTDPDEVRERLARVRAEGYAWVFEEFAEGLASVAAPVLDAEGRLLAAVHVHGPSYRYPPPGRQDEIAAEVQEAARLLSEQLSPRQ